MQTVELRASDGRFAWTVVPRMARMHNFAGARRLPWDRLSAWVGDQARAARLAREDS